MRKGIFILLGIMSLFLTSCYKDTHVVPGPPVVDDRYSFVEDFNNNMNNWSFTDYDYYAEGWISGGTYKLSYQHNYYPAYYIAQQFDFNYRDNFIIETKFGSDNEIGLLFGYDASRKIYGYSFNIDYDGNFRMYDEGGNGYGNDVVEIYPLSTSSVVRNNGDWNTLRIEQRNSRWIISINGYQVINMEAQNLKASGVGYVLVPFTEGEVDYLDIAGYY